MDFRPHNSLFHHCREYLSHGFHNPVHIFIDSVLIWHPHSAISLGLEQLSRPGNSLRGTHLIFQELVFFFSFFLLQTVRSEGSKILLTTI